MKETEILQKIEKLKRDLLNLGVMRPGTLNRYYPDKDNKDRFYYQTNFTFKNKTHTEYIRAELVADTRDELTEYKKFKALIEEITFLCLKASKLRLKRKRNLLKEGI